MGAYFRKSTMRHIFISRLVTVLLLVVIEQASHVGFADPSRIW